jgi:lysophosphatidate acyltransferase
VSLVRFLVGGTAMALGSILFLVGCVVLLPWRVGRIFVANAYGKVVGRTIIGIAGVTPKIAHAERLNGSMPAIYVANHASTLDLFLGIWMCPFGACGVMKKEITRVPFLGQVAFLSGHLLIDRQNSASAVATLAEAARLVKKHHLGIWIMPEGTRSKDGRLLPFKKGFVHLAIQAGIPVVPVVVHGAHKNWVKGQLLRYTPMTLDIDVLPPVDTSQWKEETAGDHANAVHELFVQALREDQKPLPVATAA